MPCTATQSAGRSMCCMRSTPNESFWELLMPDVKNGVRPYHFWKLRTRMICRSRPKKNGGIDKPTKETPVDRPSNHEYWRMAEKTPIDTPKTIVIVNAKTPSWIEFHMAWRSSGHTSTLR